MMLRRSAKRESAERQLAKYSKGKLTAQAPLLQEGMGVIHVRRSVQQQHSP
jgi:hypothetical protein